MLTSSGKKDVSGQKIELLERMKTEVLIPSVGGNLKYES
jgi:hypothetical protein